MRLLKHFVILLALPALTNCQTFQASDFGLLVRLPASKECYEVRVMSGKEIRYPVEQCEKLIERGVFLTSDSWRLLKGDIQSNCQFAECAQIAGAADALFLSLDRALK